MHEATLREFFAGAIDAATLRHDLSGAVTASEGVHRHQIVDMDASFLIVPSHLVHLCDAVLASSLSAQDLQPIAFCLIASDHFEWSHDSSEGNLVANTLHDWSGPETNYPLTEVTVKLFRERLLTGKDVLKTRLLA